MDALTLQDRIYAGYAKAAKRVGLSYAQYRPSDAANPLTTPHGSLLAAFNAKDMTYGKPNRYGDPVWYGLFDGRLTQAGDYLVGPSGTFFIASQQLHLPIQCVECNGAIRLVRVAPNGAKVAVGAIGYSGLCDSPGESLDVLGVNPANNGGIFAGWPAAIFFGRGRLRNAQALPSSTPEQVGYWVLLPPSVPVAIRTGDRLIDDRGRAFVINGAERTDLGWRLAAIEVHI